MLRDVPKERDSLTNTPAPESEANRARRTLKQASGRAPGRYPGSAYWLIARNENSRLEIFATGLTSKGEEALPVFSHEEEAEVFLSLSEASDDEWRARESTAGELISMLSGPWAGVKEVALDPLPEMIAQRTLRLVTLSRERFMDLVLSRG